MSTLLKPGPVADLELPPGLEKYVWRGGQVGAAAGAAISTGHATLDAQLTGRGWACGAVTELLTPGPGTGEVRLLGPALRHIARRCEGDVHVAMVSPPYMPYAPALARWGIDLERLIVLTVHGSDALWAAERCVKTRGIGAVLLWADNIRSVAVRRLQTAAQHGQAAVFLFRAESERGQSSPAPYRVTCRAAMDTARPGVELEVQVIKRRGSALGEATRVNARLDLEALEPTTHTGAMQPVGTHAVREALVAAH